MKPRFYFSRLLILAFALASLGCLTACGQKGPLYLPSKPAPLPTPMPQPAPKTGPTAPIPASTPATTAPTN